MPSGPCTATKDGVLIGFHLQPRASKPGPGPIATDSSGHGVLKARVPAPPTDGRANAALCEMIAKQLGVPKTQVRIERGETSRHKTVLVEGDLLGRCEAWLRDLAG
ncbi:MAG: DUF167 domain-containing protein [Alphaproteobacteria bacterium]|nr:DUF167 domain-containing protein [Alphaproteobacteria bacterium]